jgi:uncharacterized protein
LPNYFLDTSALAKLYHREKGSAFVDGIIAQAGSRVWISHLTIVGFESVLAIKTRTQEINQAALGLARGLFRADLAQLRLLVAPPIRETHFQHARRLLIQYGATYGLRTLDALQLAVALHLQGAGHIGVLVAADQRLCTVAALAGCPALHPNRPGPVLV